MKTKRKNLESVTFLAESVQSQTTVETAVQRGEVIANGTLPRPRPEQPTRKLSHTNAPRRKG